MVIFNLFLLVLVAQFWRYDILKRLSSLEYNESKLHYMLKVSIVFVKVHAPVISITYHVLLPEMRSLRL